MSEVNGFGQPVIAKLETAHPTIIATQNYPEFASAVMLASVELADVLHTSVFVYDLTVMEQSALFAHMLRLSEEQLGHRTTIGGETQTPRTELEIMGQILSREQYDPDTGIVVKTLGSVTIDALWERAMDIYELGP